MTWAQSLANNEVQRHKTSKKELDRLRAVIRRDLADAALDGASADRRFATVYNAALQAAKMAIACAGYRVAGAGQHKISFEVVKLAIGKAADQFSDYFDRCRRKRNVIDYDDAFVCDRNGGYGNSDECQRILRTRRAMDQQSSPIPESVGPSSGRAIHVHVTQRKPV